MSTSALSSSSTKLPLFATQGGGTALFDTTTNSYRWHEVPDWMAMLSNGNPDKAVIGDPVPEEWGLVPINDAAKDLED